MEKNPPKLKTKSYLIRFVIKYYQILVLVVFVLIVVLCFTFLIWPKITNIQDLRSILIPSKQNLVKVKNGYLQSLKSSEVDYNKIGSEEITKVFEALPDKIDIPSMLVELEALAKSNDMTMMAVDVATEDVNLLETDISEIVKQKTTGTVKLARISLSLSGDNYEDLKKYLNDIEYNLRIMDVQSITFSPDFQSIALNLRTYYLEQGEC